MTKIVITEAEARENGPSWVGFAITNDDGRIADGTYDWMLVPSEVALKFSEFLNANASRKATGCCSSSRNP